jgi:amidase
VIVEEAHPDLREAHECFQTLRALGYAVGMKPLLDAHRDKLKPEVIWNIEKGLSLDVNAIVKAEMQRAAMFKRTLKFFETYDLLLCPATIVPPYPIEQRYVAECDGVKFDNYIQWLAIVYAITNVACPAISIPAGFTRENLPVGIQIVAAPRGEARLLAGAKLLESILGLGAITPIDPRTN